MRSQLQRNYTPRYFIAVIRGFRFYGNLMILISVLFYPNYFKREENKPNFIENPDKALFVFECLELELGLAIAAQDVEYSCPILLHKNLGKVGHYFASHETGVHSIDIVCVENLHKFVANQNGNFRFRTSCFAHLQIPQMTVPSRIYSTNRVLRNI